MEYKLEDLLDIPTLQNLQDKLNKIYSFPSAIIDNEGNVLTAVAWQDICTKFHRKNPQCEKECIKSDKYIYEHINEANPAISYQCPHGLVDNATPIIIDGKHLGNFFTGQFFLEKPDIDFFKIQAKKYGFEEKAYLQAVDKVPIWTKEKLAQYLDFIKGFIEVIAEIGLKQLKAIEANKAIKEREEELRVSKQVIEGIINTIPARVFWKDINHVYLGCNSAFAKDAGFSDPKDIIGKNDYQMGWNNLAEMYRRGDTQVIKDKKPMLNIEEQLKTADGNTISVLTSKTPLLNIKGEVKGVVGTYIDITERKKTELELVIAKEKAEESDRLKSAFLANMSHEIRTPMNGIMGFAELLKEPELSSDKQQKYIGIIEKSGARMLNIINEIMDMSKIESGQVSVYYKNTNINELLDNLYNFFKPEANIKDIALSVSNRLLDGEAVIRSDEEKLNAILSNLLKNAIKYTIKGSIEIGVKKNSSEIEFFVKDTGVGIPTDRQEAIFDRFIQSDIIDIQARQGAGLGLSISKSYVEILGGKIWVDSKYGKGSTFYFTVPIITENEEVILAKKIKLRENPDSGINNLKVLIAEDDESSAELLSILLKNYCKEILFASSGEETVQICRKNLDIDLVFMDIQMPGMNGYETTRQIRQFDKKVVIIAQTAFALSGDRENALQSGCNDYISKPINRNLLKNLITQYSGKVKNEHKQP